MGKPPRPVPPGVPGILQRQIPDPLTEPLTAAEMWQQAVQSHRGFYSSPGSTADAIRRQPASIPPHASAGDKGVKVGKGFETFAGLQVLEADGRRVAFSADHFDGGGLENHAEARAVRGLEIHGPGTIPGGRLIVVVEQDCCPSCTQRLTTYARRVGLKEIEIHVPVRESLRRAGHMVTPKTASTTSFMAIEKPTSIKKLRSISLPESLAPHTSPVFRARTAVVGTIANSAAGVMLGILQEKMKGRMLDALENMPKPKIDRRNAATFFSDPNTAKAIRVIDLMSKNLEPFEYELSEHHAKIVAGTNTEIVLLAISQKLSVNERLDFLVGLQGQLATYENELNTVIDNLTATKALSANAIEAAKGAEDLAALIDRALIADWLLKTGFSLEEIVRIYQNLTNYGFRVRQVFQQLDELLTRTRKLLQEEQTLHSQVNKVYWVLTLEPIIEELKKRGAQP